MSFKELSMLLLGFVLLYSLYYLRTHDQIFNHSSPTITPSQSLVEEVAEKPVPEPKVLPPAVLEQVEIPEWLNDSSEYELENLTVNDLLKLAQLAHEQGHDFFPDNQNTLVYLLNAKELGVDSPEVDELLTTINARLYTDAEQAIRDYDAQTLTALTSRLKSINENDPNINNYTNQISVIYTLDRLAKEANQYLLANTLYLDNQKDAVHTLINALKIDENYQPLLVLKTQILDSLKSTALRAAQELDFTIADEQIRIMKELDEIHPSTLSTINEIQQQKQSRFAYLDQQFYIAINDLNLNRANTMIEELSDLEVSASQLNGYIELYEKTRIYGAHEIGSEFNDLTANGRPGPTMVVMPTGSFYMGSQTGPKHQRPRHLVEIDYGFAVAKNEVTVGEFKAFIDATNYQTTAERNNRSEIYDEGTGRFKNKYNINWRNDYLGKPANENLPVIHVSWQDANAYSNWLSETTGENYRLLSEGEFEYILANGKNTLYPWGNEEPQQTWGNFSGAKDKFKRSRIRWREGFTDYSDGYWGPAPVGSFITNILGLNDLSGNVMEWVDDCWHDSYIRAPGDGSAWVNRGCENRVIRGGNWGSANTEYKVHHRIKAEINLTDPRLGFRVAKTLRF